MLIEAFSDDKYMLMLALGSFPRNVADFKDSQVLLQQIMYVDYELQSLLYHDFGGLLLSKISPSTCDEKIFDKVSQLITFINTIGSSASFQGRRYEEELFYTVVLAHLYNLNSEPEKVHNILEQFRFDQTNRLVTIAQQEFIAYLTARYFVMSGISSHSSAKHWNQFLVQLQKYGSKNLTAANLWITKIFQNVLLHLSADGASPLTFRDLLSQEFSDNANAFVGVCNYAMRPESDKYIAKEFRPDYAEFLTELLRGKIKQHVDFPDASSDNGALEEFVESLYGTLNEISDNRKIMNKLLPPKLSKSFLLNLFEKSYQSRVVLLNYIQTLIDLKEYDEALAAFKTYCSYVQMEQGQLGGNVTNILEVIDVYSTCMSHFNPARSIASDIKATKMRFKYNSVETVVNVLEASKTKLLMYLDIFANVAGLTYDEGLSELSGNDLSFLYHRYNPTLFSGELLMLVKIISKAWYSIGEYTQYLATYACPNIERMSVNVNATRQYYKNALVVNPTGNVKYLTSYALALAHGNLLKSAARLCKFILKRYPDSFKIWNLLVLITSATEQQSALLDENPESGHILFLEHPENGNGNGKEQKHLSDLEKFAEDALNIAGIFIKKNNLTGASLDADIKHAILQLKMTQFAVLESKHGVEYVLEQIVEVFALFQELFSDVDIIGKDDKSAAKDDAADLENKRSGRWSHRPSVIDPVKDLKKAIKEKSSVADHLPKLSLLSFESGGRLKEKHAHKDVMTAQKNRNGASNDQKEGARILQRLYLWAASIYLKIELFDEAEQCIVEAETVAPPNVETFTFLGLLTSQSREFLSLQEFERSLELLDSSEQTFSKSTYCLTLLGMCKLLIKDNDKSNSLFVSKKDFHAGLMRLKNYLEAFSASYPYGYNCSELWYYLSIIYETFDDKQLCSEALWRCVELEKCRPVRSYQLCEDLN